MRPKRLFKASSPASIALLRLYEQPEIRARLPGHLSPDALDCMWTISGTISSDPTMTDGLGAMRKVQQLLNELSSASSSEMIEALRSNYDYAEQRLLPLTDQHKTLAQLINSVGGGFQLMTVSPEELREIDVAAATDQNVRLFRRDLLFRTQTAVNATDVNKPVAIGQLIEALEELRTYQLFKPRLEFIEKIQEEDSSTPDFRATFQGIEFFLELKTPDVVGGDSTHRRELGEATEVAIKTEESAAKKGVGIGTQWHSPYGVVSAQESTLAQVKVLNSRVRSIFKASQFGLGPTIGVVALTRLALSQEARRAIRPTSEDDDGVEVSGVLWNAAFAPMSTPIRGPYGVEGATTTNGFFRDIAYQYPGIAIVAVVRLLHDRSATAVGLMDRAAGSVGGWSRNRVAELLDRLCDVWNDENDAGRSK